MSEQTRTRSDSATRLIAVTPESAEAAIGPAKGEGSGIRLRPASSATIEEFGFALSASKRAYSHAALPAAGQLSPQTQRLFEAAKSGDEASVRALAEWAAVHEAENAQLRSRFNRQQHAFASLMESVNATASRALDINSLQNYMLRTMAGQFAAGRVAIMRRLKSEDTFFSCSAVQGMTMPELRLHQDSSLCLHALGTGGSFLLANLPESMLVAPEVELLSGMGLEIVVPLIQEADHMGVVLEGFVFIGPKMTGRPFSRSDIEFIDLLARLFAISLHNETLYRRSIIDTLTGVASRGHFDAQLEQELLRISNEPGQQLSLIMLDIDHFKRINDTHLHQSGDRVLQGLAKTLLRVVRGEDLVARYGGEEFAIILAQTPVNVALEVAERLLTAIRAMEITAVDGAALKITASFGIASYPQHAQTAHGLIQLADAALYRSKDLGRNRITVAGD